MAKTTITKILMRRGSDYDRKPTVLDEGEPGWTTDTCRMYVGDGRKEGGFPIVNIRTPDNAPGHLLNNDLRYEPIGDLTGVSQPPTQEVLSVNHEGLSGSMTKLWLDDRYMMKNPCDTNSLSNPAPAGCLDGTGMLPSQTINADMVVNGKSTFLNGVAVSGAMDLCGAQVLVDNLSGCAANDGRVIIQGKSLSLPTGTTIERPSTPDVGDLRYNIDTSAHETWNGNAWSSIGGDQLMLFINGSDLLETTSSSSAAAASPGTLLHVTPELQSVGIQESSSTNPHYLLPINHNIGTLFLQVTIFDDYRRVIIPDDIFMVDENTCYVNLASFVNFPSPGVWELPSSGPGPFIPTWTPPDGTPDASKKWTILVRT